MADSDKKVALKSEYEQESPPGYPQVGTSAQPPPYTDTNLPPYVPPTMNQPYHHQPPQVNHPYPLPSSQTFPSNSPQGAVGVAPHVFQVSQPVMVQPTVVTNVVHQATTVALGRAACSVTCPKCHRNGVTHVTKSLKPEAFCWCIVLCLLGCELCFWIPFCVDSNYSVKHYCSNCRTFIGKCD